MYYPNAHIERDEYKKVKNELTRETKKGKLGRLGKIEITGRKVAHRNIQNGAQETRDQKRVKLNKA